MYGISVWMQANLKLLNASVAPKQHIAWIAHGTLTDALHFPTAVWHTLTDVYITYVNAI
jgi:hypothetical protein